MIISDEIETWIIDELKRIGCDTGRSVLNLTAEELERRTDLEKETIEDVRKIRDQIKNDVLNLLNSIESDV